MNIADYTVQKTYENELSVTNTMPEFYKQVECELTKINNTIIDLHGKNGRKVYTLLGEWETVEKTDDNFDMEIGFGKWVEYSRNNENVQVYQNRKDTVRISGIKELFENRRIFGFWKLFWEDHALTGYSLPQLELTAPLEFGKKLEEKRQLKEILMNKDNSKKTEDYYSWYVLEKANNGYLNRIAPQAVLEIGRRLRD